MEITFEFIRIDTTKFASHTSQMDTFIVFDALRSLPYCAPSVANGRLLEFQYRTERPSPPSPAELNDEDAKLLLSESVCTDTTQYDPINNLLFQLSKGANCIFSSAHYHPPPQSIDDWLGIPISGAAAALNWIDATDNLNECLNSKRRWQRFPGTKSHEIVSPTDPAN